MPPTDLTSVVTGCKTWQRWQLYLILYECIVSASFLKTRRLDCLFSPISTTLDFAGISVSLFLTQTLPKLAQLKRNKEIKKSRPWFFFFPLPPFGAAAGPQQTFALCPFFNKNKCDCQPPRHVITLYEEKTPSAYISISWDIVPSLSKISPGACIRVTSPSNVQL